MLPKIFVGSASESLVAAKAVQANLQMTAEIRIWNQDLLQAGNSVLEDLLRHSKEFDFAVFIWSSDDRVKSRGKTYATPRDNVVLEAGMFYASLGRQRVFLLVPYQAKAKIPSDLAGITQLGFREPSDGNFIAALGPACDQIRERAESCGPIAKSPGGDSTERIQPKTYVNLNEAAAEIRADCKAAQTVAILSNKGLVFFGTDESIVSPAEIKQFTALRKIRIVLLADDSRWLHEGYAQLRAYESLEAFKKELRACHEIVESAMNHIASRFRGTKSGVRYHRGEPQFRFLLTDKAAYVSSYAESASVQVRDLMVYKIENQSGTLYGAFKRYFDDIWHNSSFPGSYQLEKVDLETSAGGIVLAEDHGVKYVALLRRDDGYWVLPKGHRITSDVSTEMTALREVSEETGMRDQDIKIEKYLGCYGFDETAEALKKTKLVHIYLIKYTGKTLPSINALDHAEGKWWRIDQALPNMLYTYQKSMLHEAIEELLR